MLGLALLPTHYRPLDLRTCFCTTSSVRNFLIAARGIRGAAATFNSRAAIIFWVLIDAFFAMSGSATLAISPLTTIWLLAISWPHPKGTIWRTYARGLVSLIFYPRWDHPPWPINFSLSCSARRCRLPWRTMSGADGPRGFHNQLGNWWTTGTRCDAQRILIRRHIDGSGELCRHPCAKIVLQGQHESPAPLSPPSLIMSCRRLGITSRVGIANPRGALPSRPGWIWMLSLRSGVLCTLRAHHRELISP